MKKLLLCLFAAILCFATSCSNEYDDSEIRADIDRLEERLSNVERLLNALDKGLTITSAKETSQGCTITFSDGSTIVIINGKDGQDGANGKDGEDGADGKDGKDGEDGEDGADGKDGDTLIESVAIGEDAVTFTLTDGRVIEIPLAPKVEPLSIVVDAPLPMGVELGAQIELGYEILTKEPAESVLVEVFSDGNVKAKLSVNEENPASGNLHISIGDSLDEYAKVVILATDGVSATMKTLTFEEGYMASNAHSGSYVPYGEYYVDETYFFSNMPYEVIIPEDAQDWVSVENTRSQMERCVRLRVEKNYGGYRRANITIKAIGSDLFLTYTVAQDAHPDVAAAEEAELRAVLVRLYEEMGGENWFTDWDGNPTDGNWCSDKSIYKWYGVSRSFDDDSWRYYMKGAGQITEVDLWNANISGTLPEGIFRGAKNVLFDFSEGIVGELNAKHLEGVENFGLNLSVTGVTKVDVAGTEGLVYLGIPESCEELNVSGCADLGKYGDVLAIHRDIVKLDISGLQCVESLEYMRKLQSLTARNCKSLKTITLAGYTNQLSHLDLEGCDSLAKVSLDATSLPTTDIDLLQYRQMEYFQVTNSPNLKSVNCANHPALTELWFYDNSALSSVDVSGCEKLQNMSVEGTAVTSLDVSGLEALETVRYPQETIEHFNAEGCTSFLGTGYGELTFGLDKEGALKSLNIDNCTSLTRVDIKYASQDFTQFAPKGSTIKRVNVYECGGLQSLDVSGCTTIEDVSVDWCPLLEYVVVEGWHDRHNYGTFCTIEKSDVGYHSSDFSNDGAVKVLQTASEGNGIDVVLMADCFTDRHIANGSYDAEINRMYEQFFANEPMASFRNLFNVYAVTTVSEQCILNGNTALGTKLIYDDSIGHSYELDDLDIAYNYALRAIDKEKITEATIIVGFPLCEIVPSGWWFYYEYEEFYNDYGHGTSFDTIPLDKENFSLWTTYTLTSFAKLVSERGDENSETIEDAEKKEIEDFAAKFGWYKNIDFTNSPTDVKWSKFIEDERYERENIGVYTGAYGYSNVYRATESSMLRDYDNSNFNAPSREAIYYRIHKLAYGADWEYDYEEFVAWDERNRTAIAEMAPMLRAARQTDTDNSHRRPAPPTIVPYVQ